MNRTFLRLALALGAGGVTALAACCGLVIFEVYYEDFFDEDPTPAQLMRDGAVMGVAATAGTVAAYRQLEKVL